MNEIDPANNSNGSATTETHQQEASSSTNKSPLLSSLLTSSKHETISNGQQNKSGQNKHDHGMMPTPAIVTNPQYDEANAFMTRKSVAQNIEAANELEVTTINSHRKFNNLNDLLQRNNNNNKVATSESTAKSILENCLLKPSPHKTQRLESQFYPKMDEGEYHHHIGNPSTSSVLKFAHQPEDSRKVEPLKINLNREPIRTVIKLPQPHPYESPTKIIIKPPQPPDRNSSLTPATISPTLSSSSSLSSESSFDNCHENVNHLRSSSIQVIPKLHIRSLLEGSLNHEQSELHIVPKLTITGLSSPQSAVNHLDQQQQQQQPLVKDHSVNSILEATTSPAIPKLTIKKDNNTSDYHLNNDTNSIPKLHIKTNHHQSKDGVKLTIKPFPEPPVPKLTIKTKTDNDAVIVANSTTDIIEPIPKLTIKSGQQTAMPKLTIKPVVRSIADEPEESIPKLTLKAVNNSAAMMPTFEKVVPKLLVKLPKETTEPDKESSSCSSTPSPPPHIPKLNIKPIPPPEKEVPKPLKNCVDASSPPSDMKFSITRLIGSAEADQVADNDGCKPLEINTSVIKNTDSGQDSPRIILKINKTNSESITSEIVPQPTTEIVHKPPAANHKRVHSNDDANDGNEAALSKKPKMAADDDDDDVILINDSDTSSNDTVRKNQNHRSLPEATAKAEHKTPKVEESKTNLKGILSRSLRQSRRNNEASKLQQSVTLPEQDNSQSVKEDSQTASEIDPLALSNDTTVNSNSVDELITPKRGRGRPKKQQTVEKPQPVISVIDEGSRDPLEIPSQESSQDSHPLEDGVEVKKTPGRGRGRGRGRSKRTVQVIKNGKPIQITLEGHDDDDSPSFSLYNRSLRGGYGTGRKIRGGKALRGKASKGSPFITPERSKDGHFTSPNEQNSRRKIFNTPSLFEEDTRMSIGGDSSQQTPFRSMELQSCEESQSSLLSSASNTVEGSTKKRVKKMEANEAEG